MKTPVSELNLQQLALAIARHEHPEADSVEPSSWKPEKGNAFAVYADGFRKPISVWHFGDMGYLWRKYKCDYKYFLMEGYKKDGYSQMRAANIAHIHITNIFMSDNIPESTARALLTMWHPDGIEL